MNTQADQLANDAIDGKKITKPAPLASKVTITNGAAIAKFAKRNPVDWNVPPAVRVEATARLAFAEGIAGTTAEIVRCLRERTPEELTAIWDNLPGEKYLTDQINSKPLSWGRGLRTRENDE
jgi:hypothetical protein